MQPWIYILIVLAVVLVATAGFVVTGRRRGGVDLEPPPRPGDRDAAVAVEPVAPPQPRFRDRLAKARGAVAGYLGSVLSRSDIDAQTWDELEEALIRADVGAALTSEILDGLRSQVKAESITEPSALLEVLKADLAARLAVDDRSLHLAPDTTSVWLLVGVNGVGKTTTVGKLGAR
jgi:fused signal recognition particle receptor